MGKNFNKLGHFGVNSVTNPFRPACPSVLMEERQGSFLYLCPPSLTAAAHSAWD